jgi:rubrerythrin
MAGALERAIKRGGPDWSPICFKTTQRTVDRNLDRENNSIRGGIMTDLKGSMTEQNLKAAFGSEAQANRRYIYFAKQADIEGYPDVAGLFRDTAEGETSHAHGHLDRLKKLGDPATGLPIGNTIRNLEAAIAGETNEYETVYPTMARTAREEGFPEIAEWFERLAEAEKNHANRFLRGLESIR